LADLPASCSGRRYIAFRTKQKHTDAVSNTLTRGHPSIAFARNTNKEHAGTSVQPT
jgi:hypothetical protein